MPYSDPQAFTYAAPDAVSLRRAGLTDLHPIIPPDGKLSAKSKLSPDKLGKVPGMRNAQGEWYGYDWSAAPESSLRDCAEFAKYGPGAGIGIRTGHRLIAIDIDITDPMLADVARQAVVETLGDTAVRTGNAPKILLLFRVDETGAGDNWSGRRIRFAAEDGTKHLVELLGSGQQFVIGGVHPRTGKPYSWDRPLVPGDPPAIACVPGRFEVDVALQWVIEALGFFGCVLSDDSHTGSARAAAADQSELSADDETRDFLEAALSLLPNDYPDRDDYIRVGCAIKAAFADEPERGLAVYQEWASRWADGSNDPDVVASDWRRMKPPFAVGARYLVDLCAAAGMNTATNEFPAETLPPGEFTPGRAHKGTPDAPAGGAARRRTDGGPTARGNLPEELFDRYIYVESLERFVCTETKTLLNKSQFKDRHANIGDPTTRDNAASRYLADMARRRIVGSPTYRPGQGLLVRESDGERVNLWQPGPHFSEGWGGAVPDEDVAPYIELAAHVIPNETERAAVLDWLAFQIQSPGTKCNWHLVIGSTEHGIGKDTLLEPIVRGLGQHNCPVISAADMQSQWTDWLASAQLVRVEEMNTFGRRETMDRLKPMLASPPDELRVNAKGIQQYWVPNVVNLVFFSNHVDALGLEEGDRRFMVVWSEAKPWPDSKYTDLYKWLQGGGARRVCEWLARRDLSAFNPRGRAMTTEAKKEMTRLSLSPVDAAVVDMIEREADVFASDLVTASDAMDAVRRAVGSVSVSMLGRALTRYCTQVGRVRVGEHGERERVYAVRRADTWVSEIENTDVRAAYKKATSAAADRRLANSAAHKGTGRTG